MRNRDMPASGYTGDPTSSIEPGLTKREAAAITIHAGMVSSGKWVADVMSNASRRGLTIPIVISEDAVRHADALFDELEKDGE